MIESRRIARPTGPSISEPSESGPRWTRVSFIAASAAGSGAEAPSRETRPHIPHMAASLESAQDQAATVPHGHDHGFCRLTRPQLGQLDKTRADSSAES